MKEVIIAISSFPSFPSVKTERTPEPARPANIISKVVPAPPIFIPNK